MKVFGIVAKIVEYAPVVIDLAERFLKKPKSGADKRVVAAKEVFELVSEGMKNGGFGGFGNLSLSDHNALLRAIENEVVFIEKVAAINDAIVALSNYINTFKVEGEAAPPAFSGVAVAAPDFN